MKTKHLLYVLIFPGIFFGLSSWYSGGSPGGKTGSPGDGGANCTQCHTGTPQDATGWITTDIPSEGYLPGETYTITATGIHSGVGKFGFESTSEDDAGTKKGEILITDASQTQLTNNNSAVTHTPTGTTPDGDSKTWTFDWIAPEAGTGDITFYGAFNAANGNGNNQGDVIYLTSTTVMENMTTGTDLTISFSGMTPHVGQKLEIRLLSMSDLSEYDRQTIDPVPAADFEVVFEDIEDGSNFFVDFYADHNGNGWYDAPPTDHAWRLSAEDVSGGDEILFSHNTNFTDIQWKHMLKLSLSNMNPHVGQMLEISVRDITLSYEETYSFQVSSIFSPNITFYLPALTPGHTYNIDFYADHNGNGTYDSPPTDHAWRIQTDAVMGDMTEAFSHNTNFTDIGWMYPAHIALSGMTPHLGQSIMFRITDKETGREVSRLSRTVDLSSITVRLPGLMMGHEYDVDFFADHNGNGIYDAPPADHAWRLSTDEVTGDTELDFSHNTNFTDIEWRYLTTLHAMGMTPHQGQKFELRVYNEITFEEIGMVSFDSLEVTEFWVNIGGTEIGENYNIDFYADHNGNGSYDSPPTDHAWRLTAENVEGDILLPFEHNTDFTDIMWPVSIEENGGELVEIVAYPNPFSHSITLTAPDQESAISGLKIYSIDGRLVKEVSNTARLHSLTLDGQELRSGMYYFLLQLDDNSTLVKTVMKR
ncbi:MAG: T9SS type A sorting domain-containing protein [bacterium]